MIDGISLIQRLPKIRGRYTPNTSLSAITWFRVGGPAEVIFKPADLDDLTFFMKHKPSDVPVKILGVGSNILVRDGGVPGVVIRLGRHFTNIVVRENTVDVGASVLDRTLSVLARDRGLGGLSFYCSIPGTLGGALRMNAGCYGRETSDVVESALVMDPKGKIHRLTNKELGFSYRHCAIPDDWIFLGARLTFTHTEPHILAQEMEEMLTKREETQPTNSRTGGSTFANPQGYSAWELIDKAGCRGLKVGDAQMSEKHCNFMINCGQATADDLEKLAETVQNCVRESSDIALNWEIIRWGVGVKKNKKAA
ncbi:MAG: UDP-N-acetylmuramate dehydrogenase [Alphaproteobacteria bacterium]|nr:MAG: UDP-N-acetylmuramate dehydrogenase [Alphaproteobacteria bacterium]